MDRDDSEIERERSAPKTAKSVKHRPVETVKAGADTAKQKALYGGFHFGAAFFGWLVTNGVAVLLLALLAAAGSGYLAASDTNVSGLQSEASSIGFGSGLAILLVMVIAYYAGGYVAGRMSRFDGGRQGLGVWIIGVVVALLVAIAGGAIGSNLDALRQVSLPSLPIDGGAVTTAGLLGLLLTAVLTAGAAMLGGKTGARYHRKIDRVG